MPKISAKQKALFEAVAAGKLDDVRKLLASGVDPNLVGRRKSRFWKRTLMEGAIDIRAGFVNALRNLLPSESQNLQRFQSETQVYLEIIKELIRAKAQLNPRTLWQSPLYIAAAAGDLEVVSLLLEAGTDPNQSGEAFGGKYGEMALHAAVCGGFVEIVEVFLKAGADVKLPDYRGKTSLQALRERKRSREIETWEQATNPSDEVKVMLEARYQEWSKSQAKIDQALSRAESV
jgi:ankyrin repeat protein